MTDDSWKEVLLTADEHEARIAAGFLRERGIPAVVEYIKFSAEPVSFVTAMAKIRVNVPAQYQEEAKASIENPFLREEREP